MTTIGILDIETTGFTPKDYIVEIGIVALDLDTGKAEIVYDELVREPGLSRSKSGAWIFQNSDLDFDAVMSAKPLDTMTIQDIANRFAMTAFNKKFDFAFFKDRGIEIDELDCPMLVATGICKLIDKRGRPKWPSVEEAWRFFFPNDHYIEKHRGADDALHEAKIVYELYKRGHFILKDEF